MRAARLGCPYALCRPSEGYITALGAPRPEVGMKLFENVLASLASLALLFIVFLILTFPVTWLLMLFLGNVGAELSYWGTLPLGTVVSLLIGAGSSSAYRY